MQITIFKAAAIAAILSMSNPANAETLNDMLPQRAGDAACWQRSYSDAHLAKHPRQKVTAVLLGLAHYVKEHQEADEKSYSFSIHFTTREREGSAGGLCSQESPEQVGCGGDCDSGALTIRKSRTEGALLVELVFGGMTLTDCEDETPYYLSAEPDDKLFQVHPATCPADW
ncbi:hypothetical protein LZG00_17480 [Rhodobacteraceae bacterium LMO-12]|nr:hypothetical protein [Rhodobacteraceae bacterium LMO-JJ12]